MVRSYLSPLVTRKLCPHETNEKYNLMKTHYGEILFELSGYTRFVQHHGGTARSPYIQMCHFHPYFSCAIIVKLCHFLCAFLYVPFWVVPFSGVPLCRETMPVSLFVIPKLTVLP